MYKDLYLQNVSYRFMSPSDCANCGHLLLQSLIQRGLTEVADDQYCQAISSQATALRQDLIHNNSTGIVAIYNQTPIGMIMWKDQDKKKTIKQLYTLPVIKGTGAALIKTICKLSTKRTTIDVFSSTCSIDFYKKIGFEQDEDARSINNLTLNSYRLQAWQMCPYGKRLSFPIESPSFG